MLCRFGDVGFRRGGVHIPQFLKIAEQVEESLPYHVFGVSLVVQHFQSDAVCEPPLFLIDFFKLVGFFDWHKLHFPSFWLSTLLLVESEMGSELFSEKLGIKSNFWIIPSFCAWIRKIFHIWTILPSKSRNKSKKLGSKSRRNGN